MGNFYLKWGESQAWEGGGVGFILGGGGGWEIFKVSLHSCQFMKTLLSHCSVPLLFLFSCFFDYIGDHATFDVLFYLKIIWIYTCQASLGTLVPEGSRCVVYVTRHPVYCGRTHNVVFQWYFDLISHTLKHINTPTTLRGQQTNTTI